MLLIPGGLSGPERRMQRKKAQERSCPAPGHRAMPPDAASREAANTAVGMEGTQL